MKISHYIFLGFVSILLLFSITTFVNFSLSNAVMENNDYLTRSTNLVRNSSRFQRNLLTMVNGLRGYLLTGEHSFVEAYDTANIENTQILKEMEGLITDSACATGRNSGRSNVLYSPLPATVQTKPLQRNWVYQDISSNL